MTNPDPTAQIDYLAIGHVSEDVTQRGGFQLGGTVTYAGKMAHALGLRVGIVTSAAADLDLSPLDGLALMCLPAARSTCFENRYSPSGRVQTLHARALALSPAAIPLQWRSAAIVHLAPIADEVNPELVHQFPEAFIGLTPQGWLRRWDAEGRVSSRPWERLKAILPDADAVVLSLEDLGGDEEAVMAFTDHCRLLVVTEGAKGARVFTQRMAERVTAPKAHPVDTTGAGDIFAAAFFVHLHQTGDPWSAAAFANTLAAASISRSGMAGIPTPVEIQVARDRRGSK